MNRRAFISTIGGLAAARALLAGVGAKARLGICTFSCHQHWKAVAAKHPGVKFRDALGFYQYARGLGAEGVQTGLRSTDPKTARRLRALVEGEGGYYEADLRLPKEAGEVDEFARQVKLAREAGAEIGRSVCMGGRRYEVFKTLGEFREFHAQSRGSLELAEPVLKRNGLKLAVENHKDFTTDELVALIRKMGSEWIGVLVDTGNNMGLCEEPHEVIEKLAPLAWSVHLKDMAVQRAEDGFLLSEVPLGTGLLDLPRVVRALTVRPGIVFNLEMATRDPLRVPCETDLYWATFPDRRERALAAVMEMVRNNPPRQAPPRLTGKGVAQVLAEEEMHNRAGMNWMRSNLPWKGG